MDKKIIVGITGASGCIYASRLIDILCQLGVHVHLVLSQHAMKVIPYELEPLSFRKDDPTIEHEVLRYFCGDLIHFHGYQDFEAPIASGSYKTDGMVIIPCTAGTLGRIANCVSTNLMDRAADVCLKERRRIVAVVREMPYSEIMIENMLKFTRAGGIVLPASPSFYHKPKTIKDVVDSVVARVLDHLGLESQLEVRWKLGK
jgi:4-hydroxy-3-polyprenylbenzoate decarboxylase